MKASAIIAPALTSGIAYWAYANGRGLLNAMTLAPLPTSYYAGGDVSKKCINVKDGFLDRLRFCEDATIWHAPSHPKLLITCDPGRQEWNTVMTSSNRVQRLALEGYPIQADFHPLGIHTVSSPGKPSTVFIVNHGRSNTTIEIFHLHDSSPTSPYPKLEYVQTLAHPAFVSPNAIVPISPVSFYVSNDHRFTRRIPLVGDFVSLAESLFAAPLSWVDRVDIQSEGSSQFNVTRAISNIKFANGVAVSPDGKEFAVSSTTGLAIHFYDRTVDEETKEEKLTYRTSVPVPFTPDNLSYDESEFDSRTLIVAGHPHFPSLLQVAKKKARTAPSWVIAIEPVIDEPPKTGDLAAPYGVYERVSAVDSHTITTLYQSDGTHFSSSATGIKHGNDFFVTGLYAEGILHCR
ncbi:uncharacterized protein EI90DRAFT_2171556 [Cantharellus anzutake]|uniref:uncharacterized protein n=1 Tax=Cantharellus anzutake TaxID=1750568 RepID=UPI0019075469|nr:uncharacterized protein EI90DRAFT_2171556 [Cantharellus anzutake]KAF8325170.1 hypothetical protein EI90DRAFT_2171556 [Cantharellus anzutake]